MKYICLDKKMTTGQCVLIFVEGTLLKPKHWYTLYNHKTYIPIGKSVEIVNDWQKQGVNILYITSRRGKQAKEISDLLIKYGFHGVKLYFRSQGEKYSDIVECLLPGVLIEDDCRSIGGSWQMCITHVKPEIRNKIKSIVVGEFKGIDELPRSILDFDKY